MNQSASAVFGKKGVYLRQTKKYRPKALLAKTIEQSPALRTMDQLYDCFYEYTRNVLANKPVNSEPLESRDASQSELRVVVPLSSDTSTRLRMADSNGNVRIGRILEAVDIVAPCTCYMLNRQDTSENWFATGTLPRVFVTSRIHPVSFLNTNRVSPFTDIYLNGKVTWTGEHQSEATVNVTQNGNNILNAKLVFTSLNANNISQRIAVNQLAPSTSYESELLKRRNIANNLKRAVPEQMSLEKPEFRGGEIAMSRTLVETTAVAYPEFENPYGSVFGGYIARNALETAEMCAKMFSKEDVKTVSLDCAEYLKVIQIGSIVKFKSFVCNVEGNKVQVYSIVESLDQCSNKFEVCDRFLFTFEAPKGSQLMQTVPQNMQEFVAQWRAKQSLNN